MSWLDYKEINLLFQVDEFSMRWIFNEKGLQEGCDLVQFIYCQAFDNSEVELGPSGRRNREMITILIILFKVLILDLTVRRGWLNLPDIVCQTV